MNYITKKIENELEQLKKLFTKYEAVRDKKDKLKAYTKTYQKYSKTEDNYAIKIITLRTNLIEKMQEDKKISNITAKDLENFINAYMDENEREMKAFEEKIKSEYQITEEEIKEIIHNSELDYSNLNIKENRVSGHIAVLVSEEELKELANIPYFYLDEFEIDINKYYTEALKITLLPENLKDVFPDVEFQFRVPRKEVA